MEDRVPLTRAKRWIFTGTGLLVAVLVPLCLAEIGLRLCGEGTWTPFDALAQVPVITLPHDTLGWVNRPGHYRYDVTGDGANEISLLINEDGSRGAYSQRRDGSDISPGRAGSDISPGRDGSGIWIMGGSFVQGFGVTDGDEFPAQVADALSGRQVSNFGVPGYGTVQCRGLYQELRQSHSLPGIVVYGLIEYHSSRNVAAPSWLYALDRGAGGHPWVRAPYVEWVEQRLVWHPPVGYRHWSPSEHSSVSHLVERTLVGYRDWSTGLKTGITVQVIKAWRDEVEADHARFAVALLFSPEDGSTYVRRLLEEGVTVIDLRDDGYPRPEFQVPVDGHPNHYAHARWGVGLVNALEREFVSEAARSGPSGNVQ